MAVGTATVTEELLGNIKKITFAWVAGTAGEAGTVTKETANAYTGLLLKVVTVPGTGADQPDDNYNITLTDEDDVDVANSQCLLRDEATTEWEVADLGAIVGDKLTLNVDSAGSGLKGTCIAYIGVTDAATANVNVENALYGAAGITTWPVAAAPADGVSISEGLRYIVESQIGALTNTGAGADTLTGILGDVASSSIATRLTNLANQTNRTTAAKAIASITNANLFTIATGPVRVLSIVGLITTGIEAAANNTKLTHTPTGGAAVDLCAVLNVTGAAIRTLLVLDGVKATALFNTADEGVVISSALHMPIILTPGTIALACAGTTTGAVSWYVEYEPLAPGATVTAL